MKKTDDYVIWLINKLLKLTSKEYQRKIDLVIKQGLYHDGPFIRKGEQ